MIKIIYQQHNMAVLGLKKKNKNKNKISKLTNLTSIQNIAVSFAVFVLT